MSNECIKNKKIKYSLYVENHQFHDRFYRVIDQVHRKIHLLLMYYEDLPLINERIMIKKNTVFIFFNLFTSASGEPSAGIFCLITFVYKSWNFFRRSNSY